MKQYLTFLLIFAFIGTTRAQDSLSVTPVNKKRLNAVVLTGAGFYATSMSLLYIAWYKGYPRSRFHFDNDAGEWLLKDKFGHLTTAYEIGDYGYLALRWVGLSEKKAIWYGGTTGLST